MKIIVDNKEIVTTDKCVIIDSKGTKHIISDSDWCGLVVKMEDFIPLS